MLDPSGREAIGEHGGRLESAAAQTAAASAHDDGTRAGRRGGDGGRRHVPTIDPQPRHPQIARTRMTSGAYRATSKKADSCIAEAMNARRIRVRVPSSAAAARRVTMAIASAVASANAWSPYVCSQEA